MKLKLNFKSESLMEYRTKQRKHLDGLIERLGDRHFTAEEAYERLKSENTAVGKATIYRYLERLVSEGRLKRFFTEEGACACYQFIGGGEECARHFHLKCMDCGRIIHIECDYLKALDSHVYQHHGFTVDNTKTVLFGICGDCSAKKEKGNEGK